MRCTMGTSMLMRSAHYKIRRTNTHGLRKEVANALLAHEGEASTSCKPVAVARDPREKEHRFQLKKRSPRHGRRGLARIGGL
jgi:hypothetical protein